MSVIAFQIPRADYAGHLYYELWRADTQLADAEAATVEAGATKLRDTDAGVFVNAGLTAGQTYWYYVAAVNFGGERGSFREYAFTATRTAPEDIGPVTAARVLGRKAGSNGACEQLTAAEARTVMGLGGLALKSTVRTAEIVNDSVTFAKLQNIATGRMLGRTTASAGSVEELTAAAVRTLLELSSADSVQFAEALIGSPADGHTQATPGEVWSDADDNESGLRVYRKDNDAQYISMGTFTAALIKAVLSNKDFIIENGDGAGKAVILRNANGELALSDAGRAKFGTHTALGSETLSGCIEIEDSGGTVRKIGVYS